MVFSVGFDGCLRFGSALWPRSGFSSRRGDDSGYYCRRFRKNAGKGSFRGFSVGAKRFRMYDSPDFYTDGSSKHFKKLADRFYLRFFYAFMQFCDGIFSVR